MQPVHLVVSAPEQLEHKEEQVLQIYVAASVPVMSLNYFSAQGATQYPGISYPQGYLTLSDGHLMQLSFPFAKHLKLKTDIN